MKGLHTDRLDLLTLPAYMIAGLLIVIPLADTIGAIWPLKLGDVSWRFGAVGLGSQALMTPLLGATLMLITAGWAGHRRALRVVQVLAILAALCFVAAIAMFLLDAIQVRSSVDARVQGRFDSASVIALSKYAIATVFVLLFVRTAQRLINRLPPSTSVGEHHLAYKAVSAD